MYLAKFKRITSIILVVCIIMTTFNLNVYSHNASKELGELDLNLENLYTKISTEEIISPSNIKHINMVTYHIENDIYADYNSDYIKTVKFKLDKPAEEKISFEYVIYSGSAMIGEHFSAKEKDTIIFEPGEMEKIIEIEVKKLVNDSLENGKISNPNQFWTNDRIFYINCRDITNAIFENQREYMTIPIRIKNEFDLVEAYDNAKETYLIDLSKIEDESMSPDNPSKYLIKDNELVLTNSFEIDGDIRLMIDMGVFSHVSPLVGFFITEPKEPKEPEEPKESEYLGEVFVNSTRTIQRQNGEEFNSNETIIVNSIEKNIKSDFGLENIMINQLGLGENLEGNGRVKSISIKMNHELENDIYAYFQDEDNNYVEKHMRFIDDRTPSQLEVYYPNTFGYSAEKIYYGESIPIVIEYEEPVFIDNISICVNEKTLYPIEEKGTISNRVSFLYEIVDSEDNKITINNIKGAEDLAGNIQEENGMDYSSDLDLYEFNLAKALVNYTDTIIDINYNEEMQLEGHITINIDDNHDLINWLGANTQEDRLMPNIVAKVIGKEGNYDIPFYINEGPNLRYIKGEFSPPENLSEESNYYIAEIYFKESQSDEFELVYGLLQTYEVPPIVYIYEKDLQITYQNWPSNNKIFANNENIISLGYKVNVDATWQRASDFQWSSSDENIASIDNNGNISLTGNPGEVKFILNVLNGNIEGKTFSIDTKYLQVLNPTETFLNISPSSKEVTVKKGNNATIYYSTNIVENNELYMGIGIETIVYYDLYEVIYEGKVATKGKKIFSDSFEFTVDNKKSYYVIDAEYLEKTSISGEINYILEISAQDLEAEKPLSSTANICVKEPPAKAILNKPNSFYRTDENKKIDIMFEIENLNAGTEFNLTVMKNNDEEPVFSTNQSEYVDTELSLNIENVNSEKLLDVYTITLKAKNYFDETFSYDSYILYVYNSEALKIMVSDNNIESLVLDVNEKFSKMTSEEILALNRKIKLTETININNKEYKWSNIADKIIWQVEDSNMVSLKYNDQGTYKEIDSSDTILLPGINLLLEGLATGNTSIKAIHSLTGMEALLDVNINTSEDKLYIFQVYPAQEASVEYTDGYGQNKSQITDKKGRIAIYEEKGITSDVTFTPKNTSLYETVIIRNGQIKLNQKSTNEFGLYPQTIVNLPPVQYKASIKLYDGESNITYAGDIKVKGGVYRNGVYCPDAKINGVSGKLDQNISVDEFELFILNFNPNEFINDKNTTPITSKDHIEYIFEVTFPDESYFPLIIKIDNDTIKRSKFTPYGATAYESIERINQNNFSDNMLFYQTVNTDGNVETVDNAINISKKSDKVIFTMEMAIEEGDKNKTYEIKLNEHKFNTTLTGETIQYSYEFTDTIFIKSQFQIHDYIKLLKDLDKVYMDIRFKTSDGMNTKEIKLSKSLVLNTLIDVPNMNDYLQEKIDDIESDFKDTIASPAKMLGFDGTVESTLDFLSRYKIKTSAIRLEVTPTENPLIYKGVIKLAIGDLTHDNPSGVFMEDVDENQKLSFMPELSDIQSIKKGDYLKKSKSVMEASKKKDSGFDKTYGGGAYLESEIYYDIKDKEWKIALLNSDVYIGAGGYYNMIVNSYIGPIPITAEFKAGFTAQVGRKNIVHKYYWDEEENSYYSVTDNITELRPYFYIYGFGGLGLDYKVVAIKAGPYGQIDLDQQYLWLNGSSGKKNGQRVSISGETGIKFTCKIGFIKYSNKLRIAEVENTWKFNKFDEINKIYNSKKEKSILFTYAEDDENYYYMEIEPIYETIEFEDRSYLEDYTRTWYNPLSRKAFEDEKVTIIQENAYPYSNPVFTDDGMIMAYLYDNDSTDINDTSVYFTMKEHDIYQDGIELDKSDYADMDLVIDGTEEGAILAWTRIMDRIEDVGEEATDEDVYNMLQNSEIMVSIYDGEDFNTIQLTENHNADMMPVVATNGNNAIVVWRNLESSKDNPLEFTENDNIMYAIFDGDNWSENKILYEGSTDKVGSINVAMLSNGIAAISYEIAMSETATTELFYAILDEDGNIINNIRLTNNEVKDENPQITSTVFPDSQERFIIGWNTENIVDGYSENIIKLVAINPNGTPHSDFQIVVEDNMEESNYTNFKFTNGSDTLDDLSIVWNEIDDEISQDTQSSYKDSMWGRKVIVDDGNYSLSPKIKLVELEDNHTVDFFNSYIDKTTGEINFGLLISDNKNIDKPKANMAIAKANYENSVVLEDVYFSLEDVLPNIQMPVSFNLYNQGIEPIEEVNIQIGDQSYDIEEEIKAGEYKRIVVLYQVPEVIENPEFSIISNFSSSTDVKEGILNIAVPDIEIYHIRTVKEKDRERILSLRLNNSSPVSLVAGKHSITVEVYSGHNFDDMPIVTETIDEYEDLNAINNGVYSKNFVLDEYVLESILDENGEIPADGHRIFFNVILNEKEIPIDDRDISNNIDYIKIESLINKNNKQLSIGSFMESKYNQTLVEIDILNNSMNSIHNGNIIVNLKDSRGNIIETKQSYKSTDSKTLINIEGEEDVSLTFSFRKSGDSVDVVFENITGPIIDPEEPEEPQYPEEPEEPKAPKEPEKEEKQKYNNNFKDVSQKDWFYEAIKFVYENNLMVGTSLDEFSPNIETTRAMLITVLYRLEGEPDVEKSKFIDIIQGQYYEKAVAWGEKNGIVKGINDNLFAPNNPMTREQFVLFLYRYSIFKGYDVNNHMDLSVYKDSNMISDYAIESMRWAVKQGLILGKSPSILDPKGNITRAEMATILQRFIEQIIKNKD